MTGGHRVSARVAAWAGVDTDWERSPHDAAHARRVDTWVALAFLVTASLGVELLRSIDALGAQEHSWLWPHVAVALGTVPLVWRRRWPLTVAAWLSLHLFAFGILMPSIAVSMPMQVVYFFALFTGVAWARDRRAMLGVVAGVVLLMFGWLTWQFAVGSGVEEAMSHGGQRLTRQGLFSPPAAYVVYSLLVNVVYFGGAIIGARPRGERPCNGTASRSRPAPSTLRPPACSDRPSSRSGCASRASSTTSSPITCRSSASRRPRRAGCCGTTPRRRRRR